MQKKYCAYCGNLKKEAALEIVQLCTQLFNLLGINNPTDLAVYLKILKNIVENRTYYIGKIKDLLSKLKKKRIDLRKNTKVQEAIIDLHKYKKPTNMDKLIDAIAAAIDMLPES